MKRIATLIGLLLLSGCTVHKELIPVGGSKADGTIRMGYRLGDTYGAYEIASVNMTQGQALAAQKCKVWGYDGAEAFGGQVTNCVNSGPMGCVQSEVYIEYQCAGGKASQN
jgi:hypothetical protein